MTHPERSHQLHQRVQRGHLDPGLGRDREGLAGGDFELGEAFGHEAVVRGSVGGGGRGDERGVLRQGPKKEVAEAAECLRRDVGPGEGGGRIDGGEQAADMVHVADGVGLEIREECVEVGECRTSGGGGGGGVRREG